MDSRGILVMLCLVMTFLCQPWEVWGMADSSVAVHRVRRELLALPPKRGCHLGTCQVQNLANRIHQYRSNKQKNESHKNKKMKSPKGSTTDPMGYGRRKRQAVGHGVSTPT